uniref:(California timema) hypothetical protein n=1 Tax=Timema californicum TaxID=61474 RepID=A0A7R9IX35_TIMCA|nr:unnamed protein product [Timema californicum]
MFIVSTLFEARSVTLLSHCPAEEGEIGARIPVGSNEGKVPSIHPNEIRTLTFWSPLTTQPDETDIFARVSIRAADQPPRVKNKYPKSYCAPSNVPLSDLELETGFKTVSGQHHLGESRFFSILSWLWIHLDTLRVPPSCVRVVPQGDSLCAMFCSRRASALEDLAVKPITQFPVTLEDEGAQGLGIMIIEGKHAEVGQGIFISDIQEGSAAEQAGLVVGDMILAVNKDSLLSSDYDSAASLLKKTEGLVTLVVCNPNKAKEEDKKMELTIGASTDSRTSGHSPKPSQSAATPAQPSKEQDKPRLLLKPIITSLKPNKSPPSNTTSSISSTSLTPMNETASCKPSARPSTLSTSPAPSPATRLSPSPTPSGKLHPSTPEEPPVDPTTCEIVVGKETTVEINKDKMGLGLSIVGGSDTLLAVIIIHEVYPDGAAAKDSRLRPGDQILEVNSEDFRNITHSKALAALRQTPAKVKLVVFRDELIAKEEDILNVMEVELVKKPGKGLGLSIVGKKNGPGVFISDVVHGGIAEADGRLMKGDHILAVNGQDLKVATQEEAAAVLKTVSGKVTIRLGRIKVGKGISSTGSVDRVNNLSHAAWAESVSIPCSEQNFPRLSTKRASLIRHFATWSFRRRNL